MALALGILVAITYGSADFLGGLTMRRAPVGATLLATQVIGLAGLLVVAAFAGGDPSASDLLLGAVAGLGGVVGIGFLYRGLAVGRASVVAPVSAVGAAVLQIGWGLAGGEHPGPIAMAGVVLALGSVAIVAGAAGETEEHHAASRAQELAYGAGAAVFLGLFLILISETDPGSGLWPAVAARVAPIPFLVVVTLVMRTPLLVPRAATRTAIGAGVLDASANAFLLLAIRAGLLSLVAPVAALYPASTVVLSRVLLHERLGRPRLAGLLVALVGLVLIAVR